MFSLIIVRWGMAAVMSLERPLEQLAAALAIAAGEKKGVARGRVDIPLYVSREEFQIIRNNPDIQAAMGRAEVARDFG